MDANDRSGPPTHDANGPDDGRYRRRFGRPAAAACRFAAVRGPAVIASIAYMDPGNFATNIQAGARYGYALLWVVLLANFVAMLFQALSAKLGIVTGKNLAELCRDHFPSRRHIAMWPVSEVAAMATDLAEFLGGAIGFRSCCTCRLCSAWASRRSSPTPFCCRAPGLPADGDRHRRLVGGDRALLCRRTVHRAGRLGRGAFAHSCRRCPTPGR